VSLWWLWFGLYSFGQCTLSISLAWIESLDSTFQGCPVIITIRIDLVCAPDTMLCQFKIPVVPILPWQPEKDLSWWPVDLCRGPRCGRHGDGVKREPQTAVHVHKQAASDCPRCHLQCLWFSHKMTMMPRPRRPSVSAQFWLILCPCSPFLCFTRPSGSAWIAVVASRPVVL
jgi:hypothetical protein